ncbi:MAG: DUF6110 family protein [Clostridia bacterium]|nr:DUF6110 family protein [Clostridia bacterium]
MKHYLLVLGGFLLGTAGVKALASDDAKKVYAQTAACGLRVKNTVLTCVDNIRENANDVLSDAKDINDRRAEAKAAVIEDESEEEAVEDAE